MLSYLIWKDSASPNSSQNIYFSFALCDGTRLQTILSPCYGLCKCRHLSSTSSWRWKFCLQILFLRPPKKLQKRNYRSEKGLVSVLVKPKSNLPRLSTETPAEAVNRITLPAFSQPVRAGQRHRRGWVMPAGTGSMQESEVPNVAIYRKLTLKVSSNFLQVLRLSTGFRSSCSWILM